MAKRGVCPCCGCRSCRELTPWRRYSRYKERAKSRGIQWGLTQAQFNAYWRKPCHYCGHPIYTIGLDRIENWRGYVPDNICPCCSRCNAAKSSLTRRQFLTLCRAVAARHPASQRRSFAAGSRPGA